MFDIKRILDCFAWNMRMLRKNPRFILGMVMGFLICFLLTEKIISISSEFHTDIQAFEPFIWCFADSDSILFASLALILLLSQIPQLDIPAAYLIFRTNRTNWLLGQMLTSVFVSFGYALFLLASSVILTAGNAFFTDHWSDTATLLSFAPGSFEVALTVVRKTIKSTTPYTSSLTIFFLVMHYIYLLTSVNLFISLRFGKRKGLFTVIVLSLFSYMLTPDRFIAWFQLNDNLRYYANLLAAWLSPLQQATYIMHNFGYDRLPTLTQTHMIFGTINIIFMILLFIYAKDIKFNFLGGAEK